MLYFLVIKEMSRGHTDVSTAYWKCGKKAVALNSPLIMGIVNVTPDSFHAASRVSAEEAVERALRMADDGADILDVGGESRRPGAEPVSADEELRRVIPVIEGLRRVGRDLLISVDTRHTAVAREAFAAGADIVNDVSGCEPDAGMWEFVAASGAGYVLMHARGNPQTMDGLTDYGGDAVEAVLAALADCVDRLVALGADRRQILFDPGLGFAKTSADSLRLLAAVPRLAALGPTLIAASRKRFLGALTGHPEAAGRGAASVAAALCAVAGGAVAVRVHDVRETADALKVLAAVRKEGPHV